MTTHAQENGFQSSSDSDSSSVHAVNLREDDEWQDVEDDTEQLTYVSLLDDREFENLTDMLEHCKVVYGFDISQTIRQFELDFLDVIKLINYVRSEGKAGRKEVRIESKHVFEDDRYLKPVLEDDAVLFSLGDAIAYLRDRIVDEPDLDVAGSTNTVAHIQRISELEEQLRKTQLDYMSYRERAEETLFKKWASETPTTVPSDTPARPKATEQDKYDNGYFDSYSYNDIHETMLKDTVRTDAYRDFIYDNKDIFKGKTVLDVGCGTGILSMFCARAGAAKIYAVDNSAVIDKARANVFENGLSDVITCLRGKIEEINLPVAHVDIIVSEWMGYCLLFEAMLDSVLYARDRWLKPDGLMVPSHCTLHIAPIEDDEYITENISFWSDVYGFGMSAMREHIYDDVLVRHLKKENLLSPGVSFLTLPLHDIKTDDLSFAKSFNVRLPPSKDSIDGWCIWFDTYFLRSRSDDLPADATAVGWPKDERRGNAFTTGPFGKETHWRSGVMLIDPKVGGKVTAGTDLEAKVTYRKGEKDNRALDIDIEWTVGPGMKKQTWFLQSG